jgi:orotate phosphoribosyltransferase
MKSHRSYLENLEEILYSKREEVTCFSRRLGEIGDLLYESPFYSIKLRKFIQMIDGEAREQEWPLSNVYKRIYQMLSNIWYSTSSAVSAIIPLEEQIEIVKKTGATLKKLSMVLSESSLESYLTFDKTIEKIETNWRRHLGRMKREPLPKVVFSKRKIRIRSEWPQWKKNLLQLIGSWNLLQNRNEPEYLLKSGTRSHYFFNTSFPIFKPETRKEFLKSIQEGINDHILELKKTGVPVNLVVWLSKTFGEGPGSEVFASLDLSPRFADLLMVPDVPWVDWIRGLTYEDAQDFHPVIVDTLASTGNTLKEAFKRLESLHRKPEAYIVIVDRSNDGLKEIQRQLGVPAMSLISRADLIESDIWVPEVLRCSTDNPFWIALDLECDTIREICEFDGALYKYEQLHRTFDRLIIESFNIKNNRLFGEFELVPPKAKSLAVFKNIVTNVLIMSYNLLRNNSTLIQEKSYTGYIQYIMESENFGSPILDDLSSFLKKELCSCKSESLSMETFYDIFACEHRKISRIMERYLRTFMEMEKNERYSKDEIMSLAEQAQERSQELLRSTLGHRYRHQSEKERQYDVSCIAKTLENFNKLFGKPRCCTSSAGSNTQKA